PYGAVRLPRSGRPALRGDRLFLAVVDLEHCIELRELEQLLNPLGGVDEDQFTVLGREFAEVSDQLADAGGVDVVDLREIDDDVRALVLEHVLERGGEELGAFTELDESFDIQDREVLEVLLFDDQDSLRPRIKLKLANRRPFG